MQPWRSKVKPHMRRIQKHSLLFINNNKIQQQPANSVQEQRRKEPVEWWTVAYSHGSCQQWRAQGSCSSQTVWHTIKYVAWPHKREINKKVWLCTNCPHSRRKKEIVTSDENPAHEFLCPTCSDCIVTNFKTSISTYNLTSPPPQQLNSSILPVCNAFQCLIHNYSSSLPFIM